MPAVDCTIVSGRYSRARSDSGWTSLVRAMLVDTTAHASALWRHLADLGALGILEPAEYGGQGGSFLRPPPLAASYNLGSAP